MRMTALPETGCPLISRWRPSATDRRHRKRFATVEKPLRRFLDLSRDRRLEPLGGIEASRSERRVRDNSQIAFDHRLGLRAIPGDQDLRLAAQNHGRSIEHRGGPRQFSFQFACPPDPASAADHVQSDGGPGKQGEHHQRDQGEARPIGLDRGQAQKKRRRLFEDFKTTFRARRGGRQEDDRRRPYGRRPAKRSRSTGGPGEHSRAEPPHR